MPKANKEPFLPLTERAYTDSGWRTSNVSDGLGQGDLVVKSPIGAAPPRTVEATYLQAARPRLDQIEKKIAGKNAKLTKQLNDPRYRGVTDLAIQTNATPEANARALQSFLNDPRRRTSPSVLTSVDLVSRRPDGRTSIHHVGKDVLRSGRVPAVVGLGAAAAKGTVIAPKAEPTKTPPAKPEPKPVVSAKPARPVAKPVPKPVTPVTKSVAPPSAKPAVPLKPPAPPSTPPRQPGAPGRPL